MAGSAVNPIQVPDDTAQPVLPDAEKAQAAAEAEAVRDPNERFVQYVVPRNAAARAVTRPSGETAGGTSYASRIGDAIAVAEISPKDWAQVGIPASETLRWHRPNNWRVPEKRLSSEQLDYLLLNDARFELVDRDGNLVVA